MTTLGEYRVGISFNPSGDDKVTGVKRCFADVIDLLANWQQNESDEEVRRCYSVAMTYAETAAMWAVKAVTKRPQ